MVGPVLGGPTDAYFWTHLALQFSHFEPAVRHAVLAISSLYEDFSRGSRITRQICASSFAISHYNAAVRRTRAIGSEQVVLLLCVLFVCVEYLQGDIDAALQHSRFGIRILNNSTCPAWVRYHLVPIFRRLALTPMFFGGVRHMRLPALAEFDAPTFTDFKGLSDAQASIDDLMSRVMSCAFDGCYAERYRLAALLDEWDFGIKKLETESPLSVIFHRYALCSMRIKRRVVGIHINMPVEHSELWFDQQLNAFRSIVDLAGQASRLWTTAEQQENTPRSIFSFEMGLMPLIFFVVIKCRCLQTRLKALSLLARVGPAKEGLFDVGTLYRVGWRQIELEHDISLDDPEVELYDGGDEGWEGYSPGRIPPQQKRIFAVPVNHELDVISGMDGRTRYRRKVSFLRRDGLDREVAQREYIYDDGPKRRQLHLPSMRCARRA